MAVRNAQAAWSGDLKSGNGTMKLGSGAWEGAYNFGSRFESAAGTNPEELIGAALAGCYSMALSGALARAGHAPKNIETKARVHLEKMESGFAVTRIELDTEAEVPGIDEAAFQEAAKATKTSCPISRALTPDIVLQARLRS
jgi:lipoyl-dependent peroxiredoxin